MNEEILQGHQGMTEITKHYVIKIRKKMDRYSNFNSQEIIKKRMVVENHIR